MNLPSTTILTNEQLVEDLQKVLGDKGAPSILRIFFDAVDFAYIWNIDGIRASVLNTVGVVVGIVLPDHPFKLVLDCNLESGFWPYTINPFEQLGYATEPGVLDQFSDRLVVLLTSAVITSDTTPPAVGPYSLSNPVHGSNDW